MGGTENRGGLTGSGRGGDGRLLGRRLGDGDGEAFWHDLPIAGGTPGLFVVHVHCGRERWLGI